MAGRAAVEADRAGRLVARGRCEDPAIGGELDRGAAVRRGAGVADPQRRRGIVLHQKTVGRHRAAEQSLRCTAGGDRAAAVPRGASGGVNDRQRVLRPDRRRDALRAGGGGRVRRHQIAVAVHDGRQGLHRGVGVLHEERHWTSDRFTMRRRDGEKKRASGAQEKENRFNAKDAEDAQRTRRHRCR